MSDDQKLFKSIGLKASTLKNIQKNESIATALKACINEVNRLRISPKSTPSQQKHKKKRLTSAMVVMEISEN